MDSAPVAINKVEGLGRRRVPRRSLESPIGLLLHGKYQLERCHQVGEGGMMISSQRPLVVGENLVVSFYLPNSKTMMVVRGIVRSVIPVGDGQSDRYGIEFTKLNFTYKREIRNFVASALT